MLAQQRADAEQAAPPPPALAKALEEAAARTARTKARLDALPEDEQETEEQPAHAEAEDQPPWWESDTEVKMRALEMGIRIIPAEPYPEYLARIFAAVGPGPWDQAQPPDIRERIEYYRATGGNP